MFWYTCNNKKLQRWWSANHNHRKQSRLALHYMRIASLEKQAILVANKYPQLLYNKLNATKHE
jgi:hypothetical protein